MATPTSPTWLSIFGGATLDCNCCNCCQLTEDLTLNGTVTGTFGTFDVPMIYTGICLGEFSFTYAGQLVVATAGTLTGNACIDAISVGGMYDVALIVTACCFGDNVFNIVNIQITALDSFGNPISGAQVTWNTANTGSTLYVDCLPLNINGSAITGDIFFFAPCITDDAVTFTITE